MRADRRSRRQNKLTFRLEGIMIDTGGSEPADTDSRVTEPAQLLGQIAEALDLPVSTFRRPRATASSEGPTASECSKILASFVRIRDPDVRRQCLAMIEHCAGGCDEASPAVRSRT
jgi:hypothetical protein